MMIAYIYARFSTLEQGKGSSLTRQLDVCRTMCDRHGWDRSADRELIDEGLSAFDGTNRAAGSKLSNFEQRALSGELPHDTVLVVERIDRLSRQSVDAVFQLITNLTNNHVAVALVDGERIYRKGSFDFSNLIELIVKAQLSHEESAKKSQRVSAAWAIKRTRAQQGDMRALTKRCPAWIIVDARTGSYVLHDNRADVVRRIFRLATSGFGRHRIARKLRAFSTAAES
jgi:DNA invertase Pin-like site-specific DNA recombinase